MELPTTSERLREFVEGMVAHLAQRANASELALMHARFQHKVEKEGPSIELAPLMARAVIDRIALEQAKQKPLTLAEAAEIWRQIESETHDAN